jgi:hypothetical protein
VYHLRFNLIVKRRGGAVQVDVADISGVHTRFVERLRDGADRPFALRMRSGNMVRIAGFPVPSSATSAGSRLSTISAAASPMVIPDGRDQKARRA